MKLWILKACEDLPEDKNHRFPGYDANYGLVVRAETEARARDVAQSVAACEKETIPGVRTPWWDPRYTTCDEIMLDGEEGVILIDYRS